MGQSVAAAALVSLLGVHAPAQERADVATDIAARAESRRTPPTGIARATSGFVTFVLDTGAEYKEIARNDLGEMALAFPAVAGHAIYIRTESKFYTIAR